jgi:hypothetical protein
MSAAARTVSCWALQRVTVTRFAQFARVYRRAYDHGGMTADTYFLLTVVGLPLLILAIAVLAGCLYRDGYERLLDWKPTRSPKREAELICGDVEQMLNALNRYRRSRGVPELSLEQIAQRAGARADRRPAA